MVPITLLGDASVTVPVILAASVWLTWRRARISLVGLLTAIVSAAMFVPIVKTILHRARPIDLYTGADGFSFPSGHATINMVLYGILAYIIGQHLPQWARNLTYAVFGIIVTLIAFSRIYLGAHWPSDVAGGLLFGSAAAASFALFMGTRKEETGGWKLAIVTVVAFALAGAVHIQRGLAAATMAYASLSIVQTESVVNWLSYGWKALPSHRIDLAGEIEELISIQWAAVPDSIRTDLELAGWKQVPPWTISVLNAYTNSKTPAQDVPALPTLNDGNAPLLTFARPVAGVASASERYVLRLWRSNVEVSSPSGTTALLLGSITHEKIVNKWNISITSTAIDEFQPTQEFLQVLSTRSQIKHSQSAVPSTLSTNIVLIAN